MIGTVFGILLALGGIAVLPIAWCDELSPSLHLACWSVLGANLAGIVLESLVVAVSTQGAIVDCAARDRRIRPLLTGHLLLHLAELCLAVVVQTHVDYDAPGCEKGSLLLRLLLLAYLGLLVRERGLGADHRLVEARAEHTRLLV